MRQLSDLLVATQSSCNYGVGPGIVTNNQDPEGMGRVKVRLPWLGNQDESHWARVVTPMAGRDRGLYLLPEVDDEVLVAFEHGSPDFAFVLGSLWNGKDKPPESNSNGTNDRRTLKSRSGHIISLDDTSGAEKIEITDGSGKHRVVIDTSGNMITIEAQGDVKISGSGGKMTLSAQEIVISADTSVAIKAGTTGEFKANAHLDLKGGIVNIN